MDNNEFEDFFDFLNKSEKFCKLACAQGWCGLRVDDWKNLQKSLYLLKQAHKINPIQAVLGENIYFTQGRMGFRGEFIMALIHQHGHKVEIIENTEEKCILKGTRKNGATMMAAYTIAQAQKAGLLEKRLVWKQHPQALLYWRCISKLSRRLFSDLMAGMLTEEETETEAFFPEVEPANPPPTVQRIDFRPPPPPSSQDDELQVFARIAELRETDKPVNPYKKLEGAFKKVASESYQEPTDTDDPEVIAAVKKYDQDLNKIFGFE